jgi:hypothetical protein
MMRLLFSIEQSGKELAMTTVGHSQTVPAPRLTLHVLAKNWWLVLLRGIASIVFGVLAFIWPGLTLLTLVLPHRQ